VIEDRHAPSAACSYEAPGGFLAAFYGGLILWTLITVVLIGGKVFRAEWADMFQLFSIAFIMAMTWYFSMSVYYRVRLEKDGSVQLASFRRVLTTHSRNVALIEGPHLPIGFVRFRLEGEKAYLFCVMNNPELREVLLGIWKANPALRVKNVGILDST
jgi:hypothetical protein